MLKFGATIVENPEPGTPLPFSVWLHLYDLEGDPSTVSESFIAGSYPTLSEAKAQVNGLLDTADVKITVKARAEIEVLLLSRSPTGVISLWDTTQARHNGATLEKHIDLPLSIAQKRILGLK